MIVDKIIYNNETIITLCHKGFSDEKSTHERYISETINKTTITFKEYYESSKCIFNDSCYVNECFLDVQSNVNPYKDVSNCAIYKRHSGEFPASVFEISNDKIDLKLSEDDMNKIFSFIKKYTNLDVSSDITLFGDTLEYELIKSIIKANKTDRYIEFENLVLNMCIGVNYYKDDTIVSSEVYIADGISSTYKFLAPDDWEYADITIYKDGKLYYKNSAFSLIKSVSILMGICSTKNISLDNFGLTQKLKHYCSDNFLVGNAMNFSMIEHSMQSIQTQLNLNRQKKKILFFKPNEEKRVLDKITEIFSNASEELMIFDPYFADGKSIGLNCDILKLINSCNSKSKIIIFYSKDSNYINKLNSTLFNRKDFQNDLKISKLNITFKQTNRPIHDRFIITKNSNGLFAYVIGTSLNAIDDNYFCIIKLDHTDSLAIYRELRGLILEDSFCITKEY